MRSRVDIDGCASIQISSNDVVQSITISARIAERCNLTSNCTHYLTYMLANDHVSNTDFTQLPVHVVYKNFG